jgi:hypothetical protein
MKKITGLSRPGQPRGHDMDDTQEEVLSQDQTWITLAKDCLDHWSKHNKNALKHIREAQANAELAQYELREFLKYSKKHFGGDRHG